MNKLRPQQGYILVASEIFESDFFKTHLRPSLKINNYKFKKDNNL